MKTARGKAGVPRVEMYSQGIHIQWHFHTSQKLKEHKLLQTPLRFQTNTEIQVDPSPREETAVPRQPEPTQPRQEIITTEQIHSAPKPASVKTNNGILPQLSKFKYPNFHNEVIAGSNLQLNRYNINFILLAKVFYYQKSCQTNQS